MTPKNSPKLIGVSGGIGSGKSLICSIFRELGAPVYNSDKEAKIIINQDPKVKSSIINLLGEEAYQNNQYNTAFVKERVFKNEDLLKQLNNIVHPAVGSHSKNWISKQDFPYVVKESALVLQGNTEPYHKILFCQVQDEERIQRVLDRDPERSKNEVLNIIKKQTFAMPEDDKIVFIDNNRTSPVLQSILNLHKDFIN